MSNGLPGPHHCIGTGRATLEVAFRGLRAECAARGGSLTLIELDSFYSRLIGSFSSGFDMFELRHRHCMEASLGMAPMPFSRAKILSTFLRAYGEKSACAAFSLQVERLGMEWIEQFFSGLAHYVHVRLSSGVDAQLISAYVETAVRMPSTALTIADLLKQGSVQRLLLACVTNTFEVQGAPETIAKTVCDGVNDFIAVQRGIEGPDLCKATTDQMHRFLTLLPRHLRAMIKVMQATEPAVQSSIA